MKLFLLIISLLCLTACKNNIEIEIPIQNICKGKISASSKNGYTKNYYNTSSKIESIGHYENGIPQGFWKFFYNNGKVKAEGHYENGKKQGFWKEYYKNGNVKSEGHIINCEPSGYWKFYDKNRKVTKEMNY